MRAGLIVLAAFVVSAVQPASGQDALPAAARNLGGQVAPPETSPPPAAAPERSESVQGDERSAAEASLPQTPPALPPVDDVSWRYRQYGGRWWYWLPSNRWVYWLNGTWVDYDPNTYVAPQPQYESSVPTYSYTPSYGYDYGYDSYPYYGNYGGYGRYGYGYGDYLWPSIGLGLYFGGYGHGGYHGHDYGHYGYHSGGYGHGGYVGGGSFGHITQCPGGGVGHGGGGHGGGGHGGGGHGGGGHGHH